MVLPSAANFRSVAKSFFFCGVLIPVVGSSNIRTSAPNHSNRNNLKLLTFTHSQCIYIIIRINIKIEFLTQVQEFLFSLVRSGKNSTFGANEKIIQHLHGREIQWVLVQHANSVHNRIRRGKDDYLIPIQVNFA